MKLLRQAAGTPRCGLVLAAMIAAAVSASAQQSPGTTRSSQAYPTGNAATSVLLIERISPAEIRLGTEYEYELKLTNLTQAAIENIVFSEQLADDLEIVAIEPNPDQRDGTQATWQIRSLAPRASQSVRIRAVPRRLGEISSCAAVTFSTEACSSVRIVEPSLQLEKTAPAEVMLCDPIPLTFVVTNTGTGPATGVEVRDPLPEGWTARDGSSELVFSVGTLAPGQSRELRGEARADEPGSYSNTATATGGGDLRAQASATTRVVRPVLELGKSGPDLRYLGRPATFELTVRNTGDAPARDTVIIDTLPSGLAFQSASDGGSHTGGRVTWRLGTLAPNESRTVTVSARTTQIGRFSNTAIAKAYCAEAGAESPLEVKGVPAILLEVVDVEDPIEIGSNITYIITVTNQGSAVGTNIAITADLPSELQYVSADGTEATVSGQRITFAPLPSLAPKAKATFRVVARGNAAGDLRFAVSMTSDQTTTPVSETESTRVY
ncbi:MAG: DUF11 domain-containing protein [Planctomycetota bacterium]|nr:MAG: DUF11 domain-containing protein [Planctomycetota bacterium]